MRITPAVSSITVLIPSVVLLLVEITFFSIHILIVTPLLIIILIAVVAVLAPFMSMSIFVISLRGKRLLSRRCLMIVASSFAIGHSISTAHQVAHHSGHSASHELGIMGKTRSRTCPWLRGCQN